MGFLERSSATGTVRGGEIVAKRKKNTLTIDLDEQGREILERAQQRGIEHSFLFLTTFDRYQKHIQHLRDLQEVIETEGQVVTKEYVKDRPNLYVNPAIAAYNQSAGAADKTLSALLKLLDTFGGDPEPDDEFDAF